MIPSWGDKDPNETVDYTIDWSGVIRDDGDEIVNSVWTVPAGLTNVSDSHSVQSTTIFLSGGELGTVYTLTCRVTTDAGRILDQSVKLRIKSR